MKNSLETNIMNFRVPNELKDPFHGTCKSLRTTMTAELNRMIRKFIIEHKDQIEASRPLRWFSNNDWR